MSLNSLPKLPRLDALSISVALLSQYWLRSSRTDRATARRSFLNSVEPAKRAFLAFSDNFCVFSDIQSFFWCLIVPRWECEEVCTTSLSSFQRVLTSHFPALYCSLLANYWQRACRFSGLSNAVIAKRCFICFLVLRLRCSFTLARTSTWSDPCTLPVSAPL